MNIPQVNNKQISDGFFGNISTLKEMSKVARLRAGHPVIRELAKRIVLYENIPSHYHLNEAVALGRFVQEKVKYLRDAYGIEQLHDPLYLVEQIEHGIAQADCDDQALLLATLLLSVGIKPYFRAIRYNDTTGPYNHVYVVVYEANGFSPRKRLPIDTIIKDKPIGYELPQKSGREYAV